MQNSKNTSKHRTSRICNTRTEPSYRRWLPILLCVISICALLAGCSREKGTEEQAADAVDAAVVIPEDLVVHTEYGDLHYPDRWQEYVTIWQEQNGSTVTVTFETKSGEESYELFRILIGGDGSDVVGSLTDSVGRSGMFICMLTLAEDSGLEEAEQTRFYAMQEDLNYLIEHLK